MSSHCPLDLKLPFSFFLFQRKEQGESEEKLLISKQKLKLVNDTARKESPVLVLTVNFDSKFQIKSLNIFM